MARHTFFSFHYYNDVMRAQIVKNAWVTQDRVDSGFFDKSAFEKTKNESPDNLRRFLSTKLDGISVTCVCAGSETYLRPWVRYEILRSMQLGKGLLGVYLDQVKCAKSVRLGGTGFDYRGQNPFDYLALTRKDGKVFWWELVNNNWESYKEVPTAWESDLPYDFGTSASMRLSNLFTVYNYNPSTDSSKLGPTIDAAARQAGR